MKKNNERITVEVEDDYRDIIPRFMEINNENLKTLIGSIERGDYKTVTGIGHRIKGSGSSYGFDYLSEMGEKIEKAGEEKRLIEARILTETLFAYLERVEIIYVS